MFSYRITATAEFLWLQFSVHLQDVSLTGDYHKRRFDRSSGSRSPAGGLSMNIKLLTLVVERLLPIFNTWRTSTKHLAPVPGKPISANRGLLNLTNPALKFIRRLDSVPESTINTNQVINEGLNLIHLARSINSLIGEKTWSKQTKWQT